MAVYGKKLHILKGNTQQNINLYTTTSEVGSNRLCIKDGNTTLYAKLVSTYDSQASSLRVIKNNVTYAVAKTIATPSSGPSQPSGPSNPTVEKITAKCGPFSMSLSLGQFGREFGINRFSCSADYLDFGSANGTIIAYKNSGELLIYFKNVKVSKLSPNTRYWLELSISSLTMGEMSLSGTHDSNKEQTVQTDKDGKITNANFTFWTKTTVPYDYNTIAGPTSASISCSFSATPA